MCQHLSHDRLRTAPILFIFLLLFAITGNAAQNTKIADTGISVTPYKLSLFNYYQGKYFSAIGDLLAAEADKESTPNRNNEFLLGSLYLSYGLPDKAAEVFSQIITEENLKLKDQQQTSPEQFYLRDKARFQLGKSHYQNGLYSKTERALYSVKDTLSYAIEDERLFILANIYLQTDRLLEARQTLKYFKSDSIWLNYTLFNVAASLIKSGQVELGSSYLKELLKKEATSHELRVLHDKANLALGYSLLQDNQPLDAGKHFELIRLGGTQANNALLGSGLSWYMQSEFNKSLIPWMELARRNPSDPYVQEALITIPNSFEKTKDLQQTLHQYDLAIEIYQQQLSIIEGIILSIENGAFIDTLRTGSQSKELSTSLNLLRKLSESSDMYLLPLFSSNEFHDALKTYQESIYLDYTLQRWQQSMPAFESVLKNKKQWYKSTLTDNSHKPVITLSEQYQYKRRLLSAKLSDVIRNENALQLVTAKEQKNLIKLKKARNIINQNKDKLKHQDEKQKLLYGLIYWDVMTNYKQRLLTSQKNLLDLDYALREMDRSIDSLDKAREATPGLFAYFSVEIDHKTSQIKTLKDKLATSLLEQEERLQEIALKAVLKQQNRLKLYSDRALFSRARLFDSLTDKN